MDSLLCKKSILILIMLMMQNPIQLVLGSWSASTIIEVAADLLDPNDDQRLPANDPLLHSIQKHRKGKGALLKGSDERFMVPMLSNSVGDNNQLMEYMAAAVVARATNRTLCLVPFFNGPIKHTRQLPIGDLTMEARYDTEVLGRFVKVASLQRCLEECNKRIDGFWWLRHSPSSMLSRAWTWDPKKVKTHELGWSFVKWTSMDDIKQAFQDFNDDGEEKCVALGGLFPGLRWRGAYLATSLYMRPSQSILKATSALQDLAIGCNQSFLAVHWRFEESICKGEQLGLCFLRCGDGAVIDSGLHATTLGLPFATIGPSLHTEIKNACKHADGKGVMVSKKDLVTAIKDKAFKENITSVYLATDGWLRGSQSEALVTKVVDELRKKGLAVTGLWKIKKLPNLITNAGDLIYRDEILERTLMNKLSGHTISEVEQEICFRANSFMGSGESTWSLAVFRARLATRRRQKIITSTRAIEESVAKVDETLNSDDSLFIEDLLSDLHAAGLQCRYQSFYKKAKVRGVVPEESYHDEAPDLWLDMEACEAQLNLGGSCKLLDCFP